METGLLKVGGLLAVDNTMRARCPCSHACVCPRLRARLAMGEVSLSGNCLVTSDNCRTTRKCWIVRESAELSLKLGNTVGSLCSNCDSLQ
eukprot:8026141-Heterocapsa_arctica.AAC.1